MSASTSTHHQESGSIWNTLNLVIGTLVALFASYWGGALLLGSLKQSSGDKAAPIVASPPTPPSAPAAAPSTTPAAPAQAAAAFELTLKPAGAAGMEYDTKAFNVKAA